MQTPKTAQRKQQNMGRVAGSWNAELLLTSDGNEEDIPKIHKFNPEKLYTKNRIEKAAEKVKALDKLQNLQEEQGKVRFAPSSEHNSLPNQKLAMEKANNIMKSILKKTQSQENNKIKKVPQQDIDRIPKFILCK